MDVIKAQLDKIKQQLAGLTATQRMLVGTLVAVMVLTMLYWSKYAGTPDMVPALDQSLSEDEIGRIDMALEAKGIPHSVSGGKVLVPADRKMEIVADLMYSQMLPRDSRSAFEEMSKQMNMFAPPSERDATYNHATQMTLAQIIRRFPGVSDAQVIINPKSERHVEGSIVPTATVFITTRDPSAPLKRLIAAAADGVAGSVSGLTRGHVSVIVNGMSHHVPDEGAGGMGMSDDLIDLKQRSEERLEQKLRDQFAYIAGFTATVTCEIENRTSVERKHVYDADHTIVKPAETDSNSQETTNTPPPAGEPGVGPNAGANGPASISGASGGGGQNSTTSDEKIKNAIFPSDTETNTQTPAGKDTVLSATVRVPRSFFVGIYKQNNANAKEPDDAAIQTVATAQLASIRDGVKKCIGLKSDDDLSVDMYSDTATGTAMAMATTASPAGSSLTSVTAYGKEIAIGVLAVVSLFLMSSMVRKATPAPLVAAPSAEPPPPVLTPGEGVAGEVAMGNSMLSGMELDEDAVQTQQMLEQVSTMVKENPDGAASLVKRWLNRN